MKSNIFLPKTIRVGYQKRWDTYNGNLAYIIYIDAKNKVRKEASWNSWRDVKINPNDYNNEPLSGFVLNRKAGGHSSGWNHRQTYCRVYDPRGFEFEISIPNLLYILENTSAIKGKGLEGEFVYGWDGTDLVLIPTSSPDYAQLAKFAEATFNQESFTMKDMVLGATYRTNKNEDWVYLGRFEEWEHEWSTKLRVNIGKKYWFWSMNGIHTISNLNSKLIKTVDKNPVANYAELMDELERVERYSPYNPNADKLFKISLETLTKLVNTVIHTEVTDVYYFNPEVCFTVSGIDLVATINRHILSRTKRDFNTTEDIFYLRDVKRRVPLSDNEYEYKVINYNYHNHYTTRRLSVPSEEGWVYDYTWEDSSSERRYKRDVELYKISDILKPYNYNKDNLYTLEYLEKTLGFSIRQKFNMNGKPLKLEDENVVDYDSIFNNSEKELVNTMEAING